ncbi:MAG: hypothetical protein GY810_15690 [Aureispira sp.]|nr:hypothetical protein [Aureispira sp.]
MAKKWTYSYHGQKQTLTYTGEQILVATEYGERAISFKRLFEMRYPIASMTVSYQLFKRVVKDHTVPADWDLKLQYMWQFWKAIDKDKIEKQEFEIRSGVHFVIYPYGVYQSFDVAWKKTPAYQDYRLPHQVFFFGSNASKLSLNIRKAIQQSIWEALDHSLINFGIEDAFVLFDYDLIKGGEKWEIGDWNAGEAVTLHSDCVEIAGWSNPRDGGANYRSLEDLWYKPKEILPKAFYDKIPYIQKVLQAAIVDNKGNRAPNLD